MNIFKIDRLLWVFMRVSGVLLVALIFTHLIVNVLQDGGVKAIDFAFVAGKLANPFWQWFDALLLWLAIITAPTECGSLYPTMSTGPGCVKQCWLP